VDLAAYDQKSKDIADLQKLIARCMSDAVKEQKVIDKLKAELEELKNHKCYACGQDFHDVSHEKVLGTKEAALQEAALQALSTNGQFMENTDALQAPFDTQVNWKTFSTRLMPNVQKQIPMLNS
jgi:DNA repair exonuclease SbcCD ATPase subunit